MRMIWIRVYFGCAALLMHIGTIVCNGSAPVVETKSGTVRGKVVHFENNGQMHEIKVFLGIPYAKPPVGEMRFKRTVAYGAWHGIWDATAFPPACPQIPPHDYPGTDVFEPQSENCLGLNIWVPDTSMKSKAVMFYIHGYYFAYGSTRLGIYNGKVLATVGDVIVVTVNPRQGPLGYFFSGTDDAPGNMGLYDCLEALKWVKENIAAFGGDPDRITPFGQNSGSVIVSLLSISPLASGLFNRIIMQAGSFAITPFLYNEGSIDLFLSSETADEARCANIFHTLRNHPKDVVSCLRGISARAFLEAANRVSPIPFDPMPFLIPHTNDELLPPKNLWTQLVNGDLRELKILLGVNREEGAFPMVVLFPELFGVYGKQVTEKSVRDLDPEHVLERLFGKYGSIVAKILFSVSTYTDIRLFLSKGVGDLTLICPTAYYAQYNEKFGNEVHFYMFDHRPSNTPWARWMGSTSFDEVQFVFGMPLLFPDKYTDAEIKLSERIIKIWTNFAKTGETGEPDWPLYSEQAPYMRILNTSEVFINEEGPDINICKAFKLLNDAAGVLTLAKKFTGVNPQAAFLELLS